MIAWVRRVFGLSSTPPEPERDDLTDRALEVKAQTVQIRRIRREAQVAELRLRKHP